MDRVPTWMLSNQSVRVPRGALPMALINEL